MIEWVLHFALSFADTFRNFLTIAIVLIGFQLFVIRRPLVNLKKTLIGFVFVLLGMSFFLEGLEMALFPLGKLMASQLTAPEFVGLNSFEQALPWHSYRWVFVFAACLGFASALAEPALLAVAIKAEQISGGAIQAWGLRIAVAMGASIGLALGAFRIITGTELYFFIITGYLIVFIQTLFVPKLIIGLAFDSGVVTTTMVTVPLVTSLALGLAETIPGRNSLLDGFGLIAFASLFPIIAVLSYAQIAEWLYSRSRSSKS